VNVPGFLLGAGALAIGVAGFFATREAPASAAAGTEGLSDHGFTGEVAPVTAPTTSSTSESGTGSYYEPTGAARRVASLVALVVVVLVLGTLLAFVLYQGAHPLIHQILKMASPVPTPSGG
jgi:hypothetical protein